MGQPRSLPWNNYSITDGGILSAYSLTPDQIRLLEELERQEYLSDEIHMTTHDNIEVVEI